MPVRIYACICEISIFAGLSYVELTLIKIEAIRQFAGDKQTILKINLAGLDR